MLLSLMPAVADIKIQIKSGIIPIKVKNGGTFLKPRQDTLPPITHKMPKPIKVKAIANTWATANLNGHAKWRKAADGVSFDARDNKYSNGKKSF